jgi:hypothetical protein
MQDVLIRSSSATFLACNARSGYLHGRFCSQTWSQGSRRHELAQRLVYGGPHTVPAICDLQLHLLLTYRMHAQDQLSVLLSY